jgi:hypothetical protein
MAKKISGLWQCLPVQNRIRVSHLAEGRRNHEWGLHAVTEAFGLNGGGAGTGTALRPMKGLLARDYAFEVHNPARERRKLLSSVWKVDGDHRIILYELICGFVQCEISS